MEQNNNAANTPVASSSTAQTNVVPVTPQDSPSKVSSPKDDIVFADKPKSNGMLLGMILLGILAVGGIGFGVWTMMDGNSQKEQLNSQISALKQQNEELMNRGNSVDEGADDEIDGSDSSPLKPKIISSNSEEIYNPMYSIRVSDLNNANVSNMTITIENGKVKSCWTNANECSITGIVGDIYKIEKIYKGNGGDDEKVGFLLTDGTVWYAPIYEENGTIRKELVAKKANINGYVEDIVGIDFCNTVNNYCNASTVFVMSDNSILNYDEAMF